MKFKEKDTGLRDGRKLPKDMEISLEMHEYDRDMEFDQKVERVLQEQLLKLQRDADKAKFAPRRIWTPRTYSSSPFVDSKNSRQRAIREYVLLSTSENIGSNWQNLKQTEELKPKTEKERKSLHVSREFQRRKPKHSPKVRVYSPRTASKVEICKIKAIELEEMRKAKLKMMKAKEKIVEETVRQLCCGEMFVQSRARLQRFNSRNGRAFGMLPHIEF